MAGDLHPIFLVEEAVKAIGLVDAHGHSLIPAHVLHSWSETWDSSFERQKFPANQAPPRKS